MSSNTSTVNVADCAAAAQEKARNEQAEKIGTSMASLDLNDVKTVMKAMATTPYVSIELCFALYSNDPSVHQLKEYFKELMKKHGFSNSTVMEFFEKKRCDLSESEKALEAVAKNYAKRMFLLLGEDAAFVKRVMDVRNSIIEKRTKEEQADETLGKLLLSMTVAGDVSEPVGMGVLWSSIPLENEQEVAAPSVPGTQAKVAAPSVPGTQAKQNEWRTVATRNVAKVDTPQQSTKFTKRSPVPYYSQKVSWGKDDEVSGEKTVTSAVFMLGLNDKGCGSLIPDEKYDNFLWSVDEDNGPYGWDSEDLDDGSVMYSRPARSAKGYPFGHARDNNGNWTHYFLTNKTRSDSRFVHMEKVGVEYVIKFLTPRRKEEFLNAPYKNASLTVKHSRK